ncbi:MAG: acetolactate synthase small subunit [Lachnospiraceae bacterium]|nr:acetolactate synthase small subunit [Lachnospiraceae bacterium]
MRRMVLSVLVDNTSGVLNRIANLFTRRAYNIDSLTVGVTEDPAISRMTITVYGDDSILEQIVKQINKLVDVREIVELSPADSVIRELALVKVKVNRQERQEILAITEIFRCKIVDIAADSLMIELAGSPTKIDAFISTLKDYQVDEIVRTGVTGLLRGTADKIVLDNADPAAE